MLNDHPAPYESMKPKILLVDDDPTSLQNMKEKLEKWGFEVLVAMTEAQFERQVFQSNPDLMILDIMLGTKNIAHIYDRFVAMGLDEKIPVIFLSDLVDQDAESYAYPGRKFSLHHKSLEPQELLQEIKYLVRPSAES